jgi:predicted dehydrogenase
MTPLSVGIVGGGLITQVEHLPNLLAMPELFRVAGVADPSAKVRAHLAQRYGIAAVDTAEALFDLQADAVVVATPDAYHADIIVMALERGLHVFTEKPLCYTAADAERILAARNRAGRVVQVGYMKRFDPAYLTLVELLKTQRGPLRAVTVDVIDSDAWAYVAHRDLLVPDDVPAGLIAEGSARRRTQVAAALGDAAADPAVAKGFSGPYCSSLVHDINLVQGLLGAAGTRLAAPIGAGFVDGDTGGALSARLTPGDAIASLTWVAAPRVSYYSERIRLVFEDAVYELEFPSPYLNHQPTRLVERRSDGPHLREIRHRPSYAEPFVEEMKAWHAAIATGGPVSNTVEQAARDIALLTTFAKLAAVIRREAVALG